MNLCEIRGERASRWTHWTMLVRELLSIRVTEDARTSVALIYATQQFGRKGHVSHRSNREWASVWLQLIANTFTCFFQIVCHATTECWTDQHHHSLQHSLCFWSARCDHPPSTTPPLHCTNLTLTNQDLPAMLRLLFFTSAGIKFLIVLMLHPFLIILVLNRALMLRGNKGATVIEVSGEKKSNVWGLIAPLGLLVLACEASANTPIADPIL